MNNIKTSTTFSEILPVTIMGVIILGMLSSLTEYVNELLLLKLVLSGACVSMYFLVLDKINKPTKACALGLFMGSLYIAFTLYIEQPSQIMHHTILSFVIGAVFAIYRPITMLRNLSFLNKKASD